MVQQPQKKRRRTPLSCLRCRSRKVKCDRHHPVCTRCLQSGTECQYDGPEDWSGTSVNSVSPAMHTVHNESEIREIATNPVGFFHVQLPSTKPSQKPAVQPTREPTMKVTQQANGNGYPQVLVNALNGNATGVALEAMRRQINHLESKLEEKDTTDHISLSVDENGNGRPVLVVKKSRMAIIGSFEMRNLWKRDPFVRTLFMNFRSLREAMHTKILAREKPPKKDCIPTSGPCGYLAGLKNLKRQVKLRKRANEFKIILTGEDSDQQLRQKMACLFPPQSVLDWHIERFFSYIYPFFPFLDQATVTESARRLVSYHSNSVLKTGPQAWLHIETKVDFVRVAMLLMVMRLSYLSLYLETEADNGHVNRQDYAEILSSPIEASSGVVARMVLERVNFMRKTSLENMQLLLLMRLSQEISPDDGDGGACVDGIVFAGTIISTALTVGLNRQVSVPCKISLLSHNGDSFLNMWRKMWHICMDLDLNVSLQFGKTPFVDINNYNTLPPFADVNSSNAESFATEQFAIAGMTKASQLYDSLYKLVRDLHRLRNPPTVQSVQCAVKCIQKLTASVYPFDNVFPDTYMGADIASLSVVDTVRRRLQIDPFLLNVNYYLLLHFEKTKNRHEYTQTFQRAMKLVLDSTSVQINVFKHVLTTISGHALVIVPRVLQSIEKCMCFLCYVAIHMLVAREFKDIQDTTTRELLSRIITNIAKVMRGHLKCFAISLDHYYFAFRTCGAYTCLISWIEKGGMPALNFSDPSWAKYPNMIGEMDYDHLKRLNSSLEKFLDQDFYKTMVRVNKRWISAPPPAEVAPPSTDTFSIDTFFNDIKVPDLSNNDALPPGDEQDGYSGMDGMMDNEDFLESLGILADFGLAEY